MYLNSRFEPIEFEDEEKNDDNMSKSATHENEDKHSRLDKSSNEDYEDLPNKLRQVVKI